VCGKRIVATWWRKQNESLAVFSFSLMCRHQAHADFSATELIKKHCRFIIITPSFTKWYGLFTPWMLTTKITIMIAILMSTPADHIVLFIPSAHLSFLICRFKCLSSLKQDGFWLAVYVFQRLKKNLKVIPMITIIIIVVVWTIFRTILIYLRICSYWTVICVSTY